MKRFAILLIFSLLASEQICTGIPNIAIIGGGIGGASTSYFLTELFNQSLEIDLYEAKTIGGRIATAKIDNSEVEAGGTILHTKNIYMQKFTKLLGLEHTSFFRSNQIFGIWNGDEFVFTGSSWASISMIKLFYRYGFQLFKIDRHVNDLLQRFLKIYDLQDAGKSFANATEMLSAVLKEFPTLSRESAKDYFLNMGVGERVIDELIESLVATNYNQDTDAASFISLVSLAASNDQLWSVKGGNKQVPEHLIYSNKNVNVIPGRVTTVHYTPSDSDSHQYEVSYVNKDGTNTMTSKYDIVIIATPLTHDQEYPIEFVGFPENFEFSGSFQTTYATFVKADLKPEYFGLQEPLDVILICNPNKTKISSLSKTMSVDGLIKEGDSPIWKIFSRKSLETDFMHNMFSHIVEKKEIAWKAYPRYTTSLHANNNFKLHNALYHVNAIEWAASTMEMSAIGGRNVAILAHNDFLQKHDSMLIEEVYKHTSKHLNSEL